jgi:uncharacterized membrane protein YeaQ/YmgE (transglycosylase-associated protein family)
MENFITTITVGLLAGWLAGYFIKGKGFGILVNLVLGVLGGFIGNIVFNLFGLNSTNFIGNVIISTVGAILLLGLIIFIRKKIKI